MDNEIDIMDMIIDDGEEDVTENTLLDDFLDEEIGDYEDIIELKKEEVYSESVKSDGTKAASHLARMIEHLLKLGYCTNERNHNIWASDAEKHRNIVFKVLRWRNKVYSNLKKYLESNLQGIYEDGLKLYDEAAKNYPDLECYRDEIPEKCPWSFEQLMDDSIENLLAKLPDIV